MSLRDEEPSQSHLIFAAFTFDPKEKPAAGNVISKRLTPKFSVGWLDTGRFLGQRKRSTMLFSSSSSIMILAIIIISSSLGQG
jgi:hypothetical protein